MIESLHIIFLYQFPVTREEWVGGLRYYTQNQKVLANLSFKGFM